MTNSQDPGPASLAFKRNSHFFVDNAHLVEELETRRELLLLAPDQLFHPVFPRHYIVRKGKVRISQFLDDGREVTRSVLQAGTVFSTRIVDEDGDKPAADLYSLSRIVITALGETELWAFSLSDLDDCNL